jgi:ABC-type microcin C transport system permease subunit YejE
MILSPQTRARLRNFRRIRRAWWSLWALAGVFVFCMAAEWVCPCDPREVVDTAALEKYRKPVAERAYDVRAARFSLLDNGEIADFEGPAELKSNLLSRVAGDAGFAVDGYKVRKTRRAGYTRFFLEPLAAPAVTETLLPAPPVAFPFRPCAEHPFGVDAGGRDVFARVVHGMRIALLFGLALTLSGMFFGLVIGAIEGYFGGAVDILCQRFTEIWSAMPFIYVMIFIGSTLGRSFSVLLVCYAVFNWITVSYYMRAEFLRLRRLPFVEAAKVHGASTARIIFVHILPNAITPLLTLFPFLLMGAVGSLAALDFLGFGLPPMTPSCGELLNQAQQFRWAWWLVMFPSLALFIVMLLTVFVGEGLREAFDPRRKSRLE